MANKMSDLRKHLFETLEGLKASDKPMELDRAQAVCAVAKALIESAKVEVSYLNALGSNGAIVAASEFLGENGKPKGLPEVSSAPRIVSEQRKGLSTGKALGAAV
jgi:hypothetical protein